jgi:RNA polymerase sigma-70 factor (ECF subfamily)
MLKNRDEQGLKETTKKYGTLCRYVARSILGSDADAEECLNDTLLTVWNTIPPSEPVNYRAYLLKLVRNIALNRYKSANAERRKGNQVDQAIEELAELFPSKNNTETELEQRELLTAVTAYLSSIPAKQRDMFVMRYWEAMSISALAEVFHMTENNVKVSLLRIRKRLRAYLESEGLL